MCVCGLCGFIFKKGPGTSAFKKKNKGSVNYHRWLDTIYFFVPMCVRSFHLLDSRPKHFRADVK